MEANLDKSYADIHYRSCCCTMISSKDVRDSVKDDPCFRNSSTASSENDIKSIKRTFDDGMQLTQEEIPDIRILSSGAVLSTLKDKLKLILKNILKVEPTLINWDWKKQRRVRISQILLAICEFCDSGHLITLLRVIKRRFYFWTRRKKKIIKYWFAKMGKDQTLPDARVALSVFDSFISFMHAGWYFSNPP